MAWLSAQNLKFGNLLIGLALWILCSCSYSRNVTYFDDVPDTLTAAGRNVPVTGFQDPKIKPNDIIQVSVQTLDPQTTAVMGVSTSSTLSAQSNTTSAVAGSIPSGYQVDKDGMIELPLLGKIKVGGLTTAEATEVIKRKVLVNYKDPVVNVRFANFEISILGEVVRPAKYIVPNEKVSLLDALAMAGDLTVFGRRENILLIRDEGTEKKMVRFDLGSSKIFQSPYFYLRQGDVVYVEASKGKVLASEAQRTRAYSTIISALSLAVSLIVVITRNN